MFIRFKKRKTTSRKWHKHFKQVKTDAGGETRYKTIGIDWYTLSVELVESKRIDGKPRQKVLAFIGSVNSEDIAKPRTGLWGNAYKTFAKLGLDAATQERLLKQIATRLPRPSVEEIEKAKQKARAFRVYYAKKWAQEGKPIPDGWLQEGDLDESVVPDNIQSGTFKALQTEQDGSIPA